MERPYDYLIVGAGLFGCVFAHEARKAGRRCLVIDRREHTGGNIRCEEVAGINVHRYGAHIFHTADRRVWQYVNSLVEFNRYTNSPVARYGDRLYNLPFNMNTFYQMWGTRTPAEAQAKIDEQRSEALDTMHRAGISEPRNLEEQALTLIGRDIYERLIKGYTEKQWGRPCTELPAFIIKRLPVRMVYDNNYFNDPYQGIPVGGYNRLIHALLDGIEVRTGEDYNLPAIRERYRDAARTIVYTGAIDAYFDYALGTLAYRGLRFETERLEEENHQGVAVMNYTAREVPYTRIIEHKHFEFGTQPVTYITREYPADWHPGEEAYYPVNDAENQALYSRYAALAKKEDGTIFGGRLAEYRYYDMDDVIRSALDCARSALA